jgi:hypothetical protein
MGCLYADKRFRILYYTIVALAALLNETTVDAGVCLLAHAAYLVVYALQDAWIAPPP